MMAGVGVLHEVARTSDRTRMCALNERSIIIHIYDHALTRDELKIKALSFCC